MKRKNITIKTNQEGIVYEYTQSLFEASKSKNPFVPKLKEDILADLEESREQISRGDGLDAKKH